MRSLPSPGALFPAEVDSPELAAAMLRSYPWPRMLDYGVAVDDAVTLHRSLPPGTGGYLVLTWQLAQANRARAQSEAETGCPQASSDFLLRAAACLRICQSALDAGTALRRQLYAEHCALFAQAMAVRQHGSGQAMCISHAHRPHAAWLYEPVAAPEGRPACVIVVGGVDGWCEAFFATVQSYLDRGLAVCLLELPGQGAALLEHGSTLGLDFVAIVSACLDHLQQRHGFDQFGIVGHSTGGTLAIRAAADDDRLRACCSNGGSPFVERGWQKFPRILQKVAMLVGGSTDEALAFARELDAPGAFRRLSCPLLVTHGEQDQFIDNTEVDWFSSVGSSAPLRIERWPHGEHCLYSAAVERNALIAGWFATALLTTPCPSPEQEFA